MKSLFLQGRPRVLDQLVRARALGPARAPALGPGPAPGLGRGLPGPEVRAAARPHPPDPQGPEAPGTSEGRAMQNFYIVLPLISYVLPRTQLLYFTQTENLYLNVAAVRIQFLVC